MPSLNVKALISFATMNEVQKNPDHTKRFLLINGLACILDEISLVFSGNEKQVCATSDTLVSARSSKTWIFN